LWNAFTGQAQRVVIQKLMNLEEKKGFAKSLAGIKLH
jgi:hypothetical protein